MIDSIVSADFQQQGFSKRKTQITKISDQIPDAIDFNSCCINEISIREIVIENKRNKAVNLKVESKIFKIIPNKCVIQAKQQQKIQIQYCPEEAKVIIATALFEFDEEEVKVMKLSAIGKIGYLTINKNIMEFGGLLIGKRKIQDLIIKNNSSVECSFRIEKIEEDQFQDNSIEFDVKSGRIPPKSSFLIKVSYEPEVVSLVSVSHFNIICNGGNTCNLQVMGVGESYKVNLSTECLNFGEIKYGSYTTRLVTLQNESDFPTKFQFYNNQSTIFSLNISNGYLQPNSTTRIIIQFYPKTTVAYYQRVYCLIKNHSILSLDILGSSYDLLTRPIPISQHHIALFRQRVIEGRITKLDIKYLENSMINFSLNNHNQINQQSDLFQQLQYQVNSQVVQKQLKYDNFEIQTNNSQNIDQQQQENKTLANQFDNQFALHQELFQEQKSANRIVYLSQDFIDFGFAQKHSNSQPREIEIYNNLPCQMTILWSVQESAENKHYIFKVFPQSATLKPLSSCKFEVTFSPDKQSQYFYQDVQYFAIKHVSSNQLKKVEEVRKQVNNQTQSQGGHMKNIQSLKKTQQIQSQICPDELIPSFNGFIKCIGHTFDLSYQTFIPIVELSPSKNLIFQPCIVGHKVYQTIELINKTDTPTYFQFMPDINKTFKVFPVQGLVQGKQFQILILEFQPKEVKHYMSQIICNLNHSTNNKLIINCSGVCSYPQLLIENQGKVYFPPAYAGLYSTQKITLKNTSRVPVEVKIPINDKYLQEVHVNPKTFKLKPHESNQVEIAFIPLQKKKYKIQIPVQLFNIIDTSQKNMGFFLPGSGSEISIQKFEKEVHKIQNFICNEYNLVILGQGSDGALKMSPQLIDFQIVKVNFNEKKYITLENNSDCTFWVEIQMKSKNKGTSQKLIEECFQLDFLQGVIAAHSKVDVGITFAPVQVVDVELDLECWAKERPMQGTFANTQQTIKLVVQKCKVIIKGKGSYPNLKIVDVRNDSVSVATLWENFCINQINSNLAQNLNEDEKQFLNIETLNFAKASQLMKRLQAYQWNFGFLPLKQATKPRKIVITIQNIGGTELDWNFKLPSDSQIEVEPWADPGEPSIEEAIEKMIIDRKIFEIKPKSGKLLPGKLADIELIYSPTNFSNEVNKQMESEKHFLQVILQIVNGKPLLIHLQGMTLAPNKGMIALKKYNYQLPDTPIGQMLPVSYPIEINNVGCINVNYKVDILEIKEDGSKDQAQFNIFDIKNYHGTVNQGEKQYLYCLFKPLEQKNYNFEITINVFNNNTNIQAINVKVEGLGYFKNPPKKKTNKVQEIPSARSLVSPIGSKVFFSIEEIDFGELEATKSEHRIILLYNQSEMNRLSFKFNELGLMCMDQFQVEPISGKVEPKQFIEIKLTLQADLVPSVYEGEIECMIQWEAININDITGDSTVQNVFEQKQLLEKETLFLRIKKKSNLENIGATLPHEFNKTLHQESELNFEILLKQAITDIINDPQIENILERIDDLPVLPFNQFNEQPPVDITQIQQPNPNSNYKIQQYNYKDDYSNLFVNNEFTKLLDSVMENTFYNIIQETTRKEADLLKISKTYLTPNNNNNR